MSTPQSEALQAELEKLFAKYTLTGQESVEFLKGFNYKKYLSYWDYINLDALLNLQQPITELLDEKIFITYHQITEHYFSLILHEIDKIRTQANAALESWLMMIDRVNRYYQQLVQSFDIMIYGLRKEDFLVFRMALLPASGFQSVQYRLIELGCTEVKNLLNSDFKNNINENQSIESLYEHIYWKMGSRVKETKQKALTLTEFEKKYDHKLLKIAQDQQHSNIAYRYLESQNSIKEHKSIIEGLRKLDMLANVAWPLKHYQAASRFLRQQGNLHGTGGTNWKDYLPPKHQCIQFFPFLFSSEELQKWGQGVDWSLLLETENP